MAKAKFDKQKIFDKTAKALIKQGKPSVDEYGACVYRSPDGCKCAIGHHIPDGKYDPEFDKQQMSVRMLPRSVFSFKFSDDKKELLGQMQLLADLQLGHDRGRAAYMPRVSNEEWLEEWKEYMKGLASSCGLDSSVLDTTV